MVVRSVNNVYPDFGGNVNVNSNVQYYDSSGLITQNIKIFTGMAVTTDATGTFTLDVSAANFSEIKNVELQVLAGSFSQANAPLASNLGVVTNVSIKGKAFKATSAGLLTAMQQTPVESGTQIMVLVIGI